MTDLELTRLVREALMVPPTEDWHYPLARNQLMHLVARAVAAKVEECAKIVEDVGGDNAQYHADAIRARGESK